MTAAERASELNRKENLNLVEDPEHWASSNIHTGEQLDRYLTIQAYRNLYKSVYGNNPKANLDHLSIEEIAAKTTALTQKELAAVKQDTEPLKYNPFAALAGRKNASRV